VKQTKHIEHHPHWIARLRKLLLLLLPLLPLPACIDEYWPEIDTYQNLLVVDGMITDGPGPFVVELSLSTNMNWPQYQPLSGCSVSIFDNTGDQIDLTEQEEGVYKSAGNGEKGIPGRSYGLKIITPGGEEYVSDLQQLPEPATIDSVYPLVEYHTDPEYGDELSGYQFYVDTRSELDEAYYLWRLEQTYEYNSDFLIHYIYDHGIQPFSPTDSLYTCWITEKIKKIFVFGTHGLSSSGLDKYPLNYVSTNSRALSIRYSLLVDQFTLGKDAYHFWNEVFKQNSGETTLFTQQLYQIRGNVHHISDDSEPVLGYFMVVGKDTRRIFVNRPTDILEFNYPVCVITDGDYDAYSYIYWTDRRTWPLYVYRSPDGQRALTHQDCVDCRRKGGTITKPEFWIDP
jgi:hypothetical protein